MNVRGGGRHTAPLQGVEELMTDCRSNGLLGTRRTPAPSNEMRRPTATLPARQLRPSSAFAVRPMSLGRAVLGFLVPGLVVLGLVACAEEGPKPITRTRIAQRSDPPVVPGITAEQRFRWRAPQEAADGPGGRPEMAPTDAVPPSLRYDVPVGWSEVAPTQFRQINTRLPGGGECYLTYLPGNGGGDIANVNRWRGEMGLSRVDQAAVDTLPRTTLVGLPALRVDLLGSFTGMGGVRYETARLLGVVLTGSGQAGALFVKCVGPDDVVSAHEAAFDAFVASIRIEEEEVSSASRFTWSIPAGWQQEPGAREMREVTLRKGDCELYVSVLAGGGGGLLANVNRWMRQFGAASVDVSGLSALERVACLGGDAYVVEAAGAFEGMGGARREGMALLGAVLEQPARLVTVKLVGPESEVRTERANFLSFVSSMGEKP